MDCWHSCDKISHHQRCASEGISFTPEHFENIWVKSCHFFCPSSCTIRARNFRFSSGLMKMNRISFLTPLFCNRYAILHFSRNFFPTHGAPLDENLKFGLRENENVRKYFKFLGYNHSERKCCHHSVHIWLIFHQFDKLIKPNSCDGV